MLDAVVAYLPSPIDLAASCRQGGRGRKRNDGRLTDAPFWRSRFKIMNDPYMGTLTLSG